MELLRVDTLEEAREKIIPCGRRRMDEHTGSAFGRSAG